MRPRPAIVPSPPPSVDLAIVGGGVAGLAAAFFAARAGLSAVVLERRPALASLSTSASTGAFRFQFDNPDELALVRESLAFFESFGERTGLGAWELDLHAQGYLFCAMTEPSAARQNALVERQRGWGLDDVELFSGDEAVRRFPYLAPDRIVQARWRAGDGWLDPKALAAGFAAASGVPNCLGTAVTGFERSGDRVVGVRTSRGTVHAGTVLVAAGPFSGVLARGAGLDLKIAPVRRMRLVMPDVPEVPPGAPMTIDEETGAHWRPWGRGAHGMWTQANVPAEPPLDDVPSSDHFALSLLDPESPSAFARLSPFWRDVWARQDAHWFVRAGQYDETPDHRPLLGRTAVEGLAVSTGFSGHGVMLSAGAARLAIDSVLGRVPASANPFDPGRSFAPRTRDIL